LVALACRFLDTEPAFRHGALNPITSARQKEPRDWHHASRPYGESAFTGKPAGVIGVSPGAIGTAIAQQHLRGVVAYLDVPTLGQPEAFTQMKEGLFEADGSISAASRQFLQRWMNRYVAWIKQHAAV
jgi:chromate reductase, NAD(P)H dehydrogenase (quinone)